VRVIEFEVNLGVNRLTKISPTAERLFEGRATIIDGAASSIRNRAASAPGEASELEHGAAAKR